MRHSTFWPEFERLLDSYSFDEVGILSGFGQDADLLAERLRVDGASLPGEVRQWFSRFGGQPGRSEPGLFGFFPCTLQEALDWREITSSRGDRWSAYLGKLFVPVMVDSSGATILAFTPPGPSEYTQTVMFVRLCDSDQITGCGVKFWVIISLLFAARKIPEVVAHRLPVQIEIDEL